MECKPQKSLAELQKQSLDGMLVFVFILVGSLFCLRYRNSQVEVTGLTCNDILIY
jgi:hypothetical protein